MWKDTGYPIRILTTLKALAVGFMAHMGMLFMLNERGQGGAGEDSFIATLPEEVRAEIPEEILKDPEITQYKTVGDFLKGHTALTKASKDWLSGLPDDIKTNPNVTKYKTKEEFFKGHLNAVQLLSQKGVIIPKDDAPQEEKDKFYITLGRPEKVEGYKLTTLKPEELHPTLKITPEGQKLFSGVAFKANLSNSQADIVQQEYSKIFSQILTQIDAQEEKVFQDAETKLRQDLGQDYDKGMVLARRMVERYGGKEAVDAFGDLGNNPFVLRTLINIGKKFSEDGIDKIGMGDALTMDATQAKKKIAEIQGADRKTHPYWNENDPKHQEAVALMTELYEIADGGGE